MLTLTVLSSLSMQGRLQRHMLSLQILRQTCYNKEHLKCLGVTGLHNGTMDQTWKYKFFQTCLHLIYILINMKNTGLAYFSR